MSTDPTHNGHQHRDKRRREDRRREAIEHLNAVPDLYAARNARALNQRIARHTTKLEMAVPRAPQRDCSALAERIVDKQLSRAEAVTLLNERWGGGS